jgi:hypothetical protein
VVSAPDLGALVSQIIMYLLPALTCVAVILYLLRNRYASGLNHIPGPWLASFTQFWKVWYITHCSDRRNDIYVDVMKQYGDVVRIGPAEVIFADPKAIVEIYGTKGAHQKVCATFERLVRRRLITFR